MAASRDIRSLQALVTTGSTARVLNLHSRARDPGQAACAGRPLFDHPSLDRAIIIKHRLRPDERELFGDFRTIATKVLIPVDPDDLFFGAYGFMVGQRGVDGLYVEALGMSEFAEAQDRDRQVLMALDELPSLDPFLMREHLKRRGISADDSYFEISAADVERMFGFVQDNIVPLVALVAGGEPSAEQAKRLTQKILAADLDATMEPLRATLKMTPQEFMEGIFSWKGFLYYKWVLSNHLMDARDIAARIATARISADATMAEQQYISGARTRLRDGILETCKKVMMALASYDGAFKALTEQANPITFRNFLLHAPILFFDVGERLGALQHITSFWRYRFPTGRRELPAAELFDLLSDFETSLGLGKAGEAWG